MTLLRRLDGKSALESRPLAGLIATTGAQSFSGRRALSLLSDVLLGDRGEQRDEHADPGQDVEDREYLGASGGRVKVSVAHRGQGHDREVEGLDEGPVLKAPVEDRPREHQSGCDERQCFGLRVAPDTTNGPSKSPEREGQREHENGFAETMRFPGPCCDSARKRLK